ncbi:MAG: glycosyltransferase family 9 protein, partial [bacterium]
SEPVYARYVGTADRTLAATPVGALGMESGEVPLPRLGLDPGAVAWAKGWLADQGLRPGQKLLAVAPGAAWATKRWGVQHLAQCLDMVAEFDRVRFLLVGSEREAPLLDAVSGALRKSRALLLRSERDTGDLRRLAALLACCDHFLGHDSGPMHVAAALGLRVSALFGPTVQDFGFFPAGPGHRVFERDMACRPCSVHGTDACPLGHHDCMEQIEPFDVARHLRVVLGLEAEAR